jgi:hypothetical protein
MFDCSIFTEYDEGDLSNLSEHISNKWRSRLTKEQCKKLKKSRGKTEEEKVSKVDETMALVCVTVKSYFVKS